jgi:integrase
MPLLRRFDQIPYEEGRQLLIDYYTTSRKRNLKEAGSRLKHLDLWFKKKKLIYVQNYVRGYIKQRWDEGAADATINRKLETLIKMLHVAYERNKLSRLPVIHKLTLDNVRKGFFEHDMSIRARSFLQVDYPLAITIDKVYGWRTQSEVLARQWRHVDLTVGTLRLDPGETKNKNGRVVYLTQDLHTMFAAQLARVRALEQKLGKVIPYVFAHLEGHLQGKRIKDFKKAWEKACINAGCPGMHRHDFRRTAVRNFERAGVPRSIP